MVTIKCQHSGIEFEAKSTRTRQHPLVAAFKNESVRGNYSQAMEALEKAAKVGGYTTIEEYMTLVKKIMSGAVAAKNEAINRQRQAEREAEKAVAELRARREAQNAHLRQHGYRWQKHYIDAFDHYEEPEPDDRFAWVLVAPDGRCDVSVAQALDEIERGAEVVLAEIAAQKEASEKAQREKEMTEQAEMEADRQARQTFEEQLAGLTYVSYGSIHRDELVIHRNQAIHFKSGWYTTGGTYIPVETPHGAGWLCEFGNTVTAYVPQETADSWFLRQWQEEASAQNALDILNNVLKHNGKGVYGAEYALWVFNRIGEDTLVELAKSEAVKIERGHSYAYGFASKFYRIPLTYIDKKLVDGNWEEFVLAVGYGNIQQDRDIKDSWIPLDEAADSDDWPTTADAQAAAAETERVSEFFSAFFGGN
ncbi:MAG: hypothetical protein H6658_02125 [Ardenticatenaceae bacterium]|nr:hypothetical protein [Ardenticatenaceae bacterium]